MINIKHITKEEINRVIAESWKTVEKQPFKELNVPPKIIVKAYKQVRIGKDTRRNGVVYPLYVDSNESWKIGQWYAAGVGEYEIEIDDKTGKPTGKKRVKSKLGNLAFRPGLHFGSIPYAPHIYSKKPNFADEKLPINRDANGKLRKDYDYSKTRYAKENVVWAECSIAFDVDFTDIAMHNGISLNKDKKLTYNPINADIDYLPKQGDKYGGYIYRTNTNAPKYCTWYISSAMKINRILSDDEVRTILSDYNIKPLDRKTSIDFNSIFGVKPSTNL